MRRLPGPLTCTLLILSALQQTAPIVRADDLEIFYQQDTVTNVLFILDNSLSMRCPASHEGNYDSGICSGSYDPPEATRLDIVKAEGSKLLDDLGDQLNIGLMTFNPEDGGRVDFPVSPLGLHREAMATTLSEVDYQRYTPLSETLLEATRYLLGGDIINGTNSVDSARHQDASGNYDGTYASPLGNGCRTNNHIVLLTDGAPRSDGDLDDVIRQSIGMSDSHDCGEVPESADQTGACLDDLAGWLNSEHGITTHTIGFYTDQSLLAETALKGGGDYHTADTAAGLKTALESIVASVRLGDASFVAPAVSVSAYNRLRHDDRLFFGLFSPYTSDRWPGNLKQYALSPEGEILDANGEPAIDPLTGYFSDTSRSFWSSGTDGSDTERGGAMEQLDTNRRLYTYTGSAAPDEEALTAGVNQLDTGNSLLTPTLMGISVDAYDERAALLQWARSRFIGDVIHSKPLLIHYGTHAETRPDGTVGETSDDTVFFSDNLGFIHGIDPDDGRELFAFMPQALLPNIARYAANRTGNPKPYGLDGPIASWRHDANGDGTIDPDVGDHVYLYQSMRRGGRDLYALDVTDRDAPVLKWRISGGTDAAFSQLGQTWSKPVLTRIRSHCQIEEGSLPVCDEHRVLVLAGGYDADQDEAVEPAPDAIGNAQFIIDAESGALLWSAGTASSNHLTLSQMTQSFPGDITVIDINQDGFADYFFAADTGGRLWRFDFNTYPVEDDNSDLVTAGIIADLGGTDSANNRRFYNASNVTLHRGKGTNNDLLTLAIGSGFRAHPLDRTVDDRFYVIYHRPVYGPPVDANGDITYLPVTEPDLFDATESSAIPATKAGWYIRLAAGEKVLNTSVSFQGKVLFTTWQPAGETTEASCSSAPGINRQYYMDLLNGAAVSDSGKRFQTLTGNNSILPRTGLLFTPDRILACAGTRCTIELDTELKGSASLDSPTEAQETVGDSTDPGNDSEARQTSAILLRYWKQYR